MIKTHVLNKEIQETVFVPMSKFKNDKIINLLVQRRSYGALDLKRVFMGNDSFAFGHYRLDRPPGDQ